MCPRQPSHRREATSRTRPERYRESELSRLRLNSDRGSQYTSKVFRDVLSDLDLRASMERVGSGSDNAVAESRLATLKTEIETTMWATREQARADVFVFIQRYNRNRRNSALNYLTPEETELRYRHELLLAT